MITSDLPSRHVQHVAELVKRLTPAEIQELLRLVPRLRAASVAASQQDELARWAREQMAKHADQARPMQAEDDFLNDTTVADYFAQPEEERERIWAELYTAAIETRKGANHDPRPDRNQPSYYVWQTRHQGHPDYG